MPIIQISMVEGRSAEQLEALGKAITQAVIDTIDAPPETVKIIMSEHPAERWFSAGTSIAARRRKEKAG